MQRSPLDTIVILLLIAWLCGWLFVPAAGYLIHLLLPVIVIAIVIRVIQTKRSMALSTRRSY